MSEGQHTEEERLKVAINGILDGLDTESLRGIHIFLYNLYGAGTSQ